MATSTSYRLLQIALAAFGTVMICLYPLAVVWPSGWAWHPGAPHESGYFMMIVGVYATLGAFLWIAARRPEANVSLIWFTVVSSLVHAAIMTFQSFGGDHHMGHLAGDVPALLLVAVVLSVLMRTSGLKQPANSALDHQVRTSTKPPVAEVVSRGTNRSTPRGSANAVRRVGVRSWWLAMPGVGVLVRRSARSVDGVRQRCGRGDPVRGSACGAASSPTDRPWRRRRLQR